MINKKAFTLVEMIVAMTILVILTTIWFLSVRWWTASARDSVRIDDVNKITTAIDLYHVDRWGYPEPTDAVDITHSWATVWTQWWFWRDTIRQVGRIFWELQDPWYEIDYTYSVTNSRKEYQLSYVLEDPIDNLTSAADISYPGLIPSTYASGDFSPLEFNPIIWLDALDVDGDDDITDNPSNNANLTAWINKSTAGTANNPTLTHWNLKYSTNWFDGSYPWVFIANNRWLRLNNSAITSGDIFYVVQNNDPFNSTDKKGIWLQATTWSYLIGYYDKHRNSLSINGSPDHASNNPATKSNRTDAFIYWYHTDNTNYSFRDTGNVVSQWAANSISWREWAFNRAWASNQAADFVVSEILIFSSSLSASEKEKVEWYLAHKWGQDSVLPANHPYKNTPPEWWTPPPIPDSTPDAFSFNAITNASLSTSYLSNSITISGVNTSIPISVVDGEYSINSGSVFTTATWSVNSGDVITLRQTSANTDNTETIATVTIWGLSEDFSVTTLVADTTPDPFSFSTMLDADVNTSYVSPHITVTSVNSWTPISISGWDSQYKIHTFEPYDVTWSGSATASSTNSWNNAIDAFDNNLLNGWGSTNSTPSWLQYDLGSGASDIVNRYTLYRSSSQPWDWWATESPKDWRFEWSNNGSTWTLLDTQSNQYIYEDQAKKHYTFSNTTSYRYYRLYITDSNASDGTHWVNITEMELLNDGINSYTSASGTVNSGESVTIMMTSSSNAASTETSTLTIWGISEDFEMVTFAPDSTPDHFSFSDISNATLNTLYTSNNIVVSGINTWSTISISGDGQYSVNGWSYTTSAATVYNGDTVNIRQTSGSADNIITSSSLDIWGITRVYNVSTPNSWADTTPDPFTFLDITDANLATEYNSIDIIISWINDDTPISISWWQYDINGSKSYTSATWTVSNGDIISLRATSSPVPWNTIDARLTIWGVFDEFNITTVPPDDIPDDYTLWYVTDALLDRTYNSAPIVVSGINVGTSIDVTHGGWKYSVNGWPWQNWAGTVYNWDVVVMHLRSLISGNRNVWSELNIWWIIRRFDITTLLDDDPVPDDFTFNDVIDANLNTLYTDSITVSGINTGTSITIADGWEYSINGWTYTIAPWTVYNWDVVTVRLTSSDTMLDSVNSNVTIWWKSDIYTVTTIADEPELASVVARETSNVYVTWNFNGLFSHGVSSLTWDHYVFVTPSIITTDTSDTNFLNIINDKKFVYTGYHNYPATYTAVDQNLTQTWWFDQYRISGPIIFEWNKQDLTAYSGIKQIDNGVRSTYRTTELYRQSAKYLDNYWTSYVEDILWNIIWINPIKPYYCSDILDKQFTENIASYATITATQNTLFWDISGTWWIANGIKSTESNLDNEYHSDAINAFIDFQWDEDQPVWFIRIYNRTECCSSRLSWATISLYNSTNALLYTHTLWDTTNDYVVDLDLEWIWQLHEDVRRVTIRSQWPDSYLNLREVEVYAWWRTLDGLYLVDSDGVWWQKPYEVYCDMNTDGWGWTKIWDNHVLNWDFSGWNHALGYPANEASWIDNNAVVLINNPSWNPYAIRQRSFWVANSDIDYDIIFSDLLSFQPDTEIRLSAWVADAWDEWDSNDGWKWYIFKNRLTYKDGSFIENGERVTLDTQNFAWKTWKLQMVRIPITKEVESFIWQVWNGTETSGARDFYFADLQAEIYYK